MFLRAKLKGEQAKLKGILLPEPASNRPVSIPRGPSRRIDLAAHMFSGPRRAGDVHHWWATLATHYGIETAVEDYDICILTQHDLTQSAFFGWILWMGKSNGFWGSPRVEPGPLLVLALTLAHPPCELGTSLGVFQICQRGKPKLFRRGNVLLMHFIELCYAVAACLGFYILEHPEDP
eukprot:7639185-Heterocapsa_arctica.AAC.1